MKVRKISRRDRAINKMILSGQGLPPIEKENTGSQKGGATKERDFLMDDILYHLKRNRISSIDGTTAMAAMVHEINYTQENHLDLAEKCGCADSCIECWQMGDCVRRRAEKYLLHE